MGRVKKREPERKNESEINEIDEISENENEKYNFNFTVKITQTDLACQEFLYGDSYGSGEGAFGVAEDPLIFQNSSYISKLHFINNYSGGILAKDKIEDMPEKYRRFIKSEPPTEAEMIKNYQNEMTMLANREEIGQNVFYSSLSATSPSTSPATSSSSSASKSTSKSAAPAVTASGKSNQVNANQQDIDNFNAVDFLGDFDFTALFESGLFDNLDALDDFVNSGNFDGLENLESLESLENLQNEYANDYSNYKDDEEIKNILFLTNIYNGELFKMSKVHYDFSVLGSITLNDDGTLNVKYDESETTGCKDSYIQFLFHPDNKNILTIHRKYFFDTWLTLEKNKRVSIEKQSKFSGAVITTNTKELKNNMTLNGGNMRIVYTTETDGIPTESVVYSVHAEPVSPGSV